MDSDLARKLLIKPDQRVLVWEAPAGFIESLIPLPAGAHLLTEADGDFDLVLAFCQNRARVVENTRLVLTSLRPRGVLWMIYPKRGKGIQTDINRDTGWDSLVEVGWQAIANVAVDETWSALRFKPLADIPSRRP